MWFTSPDGTDLVRVLAGMGYTGEFGSGGFFGDCWFVLSMLLSHSNGSGVECMVLFVFVESYHISWCILYMCWEGLWRKMVENELVGG